MSTKHKIIGAMPIEQNFRAADIADAVFPHLVRSDTEGRTFNRGVGVVGRELRKIRGVQEVSYGVFYAHSEYF